MSSTAHHNNGNTKTNDGRKAHSYPGPMGATKLRRSRPAANMMLVEPMTVTAADTWRESTPATADNRCRRLRPARMAADIRLLPSPCWHHGGVPTVWCQAIRWVSDDLFPGWVEVRLTDAGGTAYAFFGKPPIFEAGNRLRKDAQYPLNVQLDCQIESDDGGEVVDIALVHATTDDGLSRFRVARQLIG